MRPAFLSCSDHSYPFGLMSLGQISASPQHDTQCGIVPHSFPYFHVKDEKLFFPIMVFLSGGEGVVEPPTVQHTVHLFPS